MSRLVNRIAELPEDERLRALAKAYGLVIQNVSWEDSGRSKNSVWGPNISDMTLVTQNVPMPVIRKDNFSDITADVKIGHFRLMVGNETRDTDTLREVGLKQYLQQIGHFTGNPNIKSLFDESRDDTVLTSVQYCVLPLNQGQVHFNVSLFNYQSEEDNPAVLVIMGTQNGTSTQFSTDRVLLFNKHGFGYDLTATRLSEDRRKRGVESKGQAATREESSRGALFIFQVPLKKRPPMRRRPILYAEAPPSASMMSMSQSLRKTESRLQSLGFEQAVLGVGKPVTVFKGTQTSSGKWLECERDSRFPIRCTIQLYNTTDTADIPESTIREMSRTIDQVYAGAAASGSLVLNANSARQTEPIIRPDDYVRPCGSVSAEDASQLGCHGCGQPRPPDRLFGIF